MSAATKPDRSSPTAPSDLAVIDGVFPPVQRAEWLTLAQAVEITGLTERHISRLAKEGRLRTQLSADRGRNGKQQRLYLRSSVERFKGVKVERSETVAGGQCSVASEDKTETPATDHRSPTTALATVPLTTLLRASSLATALAAQNAARDGQLSLLPLPPPPGVAPARWEVALKRWELVKPLLNGDYKQTLLGGKCDYVKFVAEANRVSERTILGWRARALQTDAAGNQLRVLGLIDQPRADKGTSKRPLTAEHQIQLRALYNRGYNPRMCWRELRRACKHDGLADDAIPSYRQVLNFCHGLPRGDRKLRLMGQRKFAQDELFYIRLLHDNFAPMELAALDHTQLDDLVDFHGRACFPWLTLFLDWHSRYPLGFWLSETPSSFTVAMASRMMFCFFGAPGEVLTDQGRDIRGAYISGDAFARRLIRTPNLSEGAADDEAEPSRTWRGVLESAGVRRIRFSQGRHPLTKGCIERFFGTIKHDFCPRFPESYRGSVKQLRGEVVDPLMREHTRALKSGRPSPLVSIHDYARHLWHWLFGDYVHREHAGQGMRGRTPHEAFAAAAPQLKPIEGPHADLLLLKREPRKVIRGGVEIFCERYEGADVESAYELSLHKDHDTEVLYNPHGALVRIAGLEDLSAVIVQCRTCNVSVRAHCAHPLSMKDVDQKVLAGRLKLRADVGKLRKRLVEKSEELLREPLTRVDLSNPPQPASPTPATPREIVRVAPADPRYARPASDQRPAAGARKRYTTFISDAAEEDAALFAPAGAEVDS